MQLHIRHLTTYTYSEPLTYSIQSLRLTPRGCGNQQVMRWSVTGMDRGRLPEVIDAFGNPVQTLSVTRRPQRDNLAAMQDPNHNLWAGGQSQSQSQAQIQADDEETGPADEIVIWAEGDVVTQDSHGIIRNAEETFPVDFYLRDTPLTEVNAELGDLADSAPGDSDDVTRIHKLMQAIRDRVEYRTGVTHAATPAAVALEHGHGVCQDHAHVLIACARHLGYPARYINGYMHVEGEEDGPYEAAHAWAEIHLPDLGWVGFDPANRVCPTEGYVRMSVGLDFGSATPVRGVRTGGGEETMTVEVHVSRVD